MIWAAALDLSQRARACDPGICSSPGGRSQRSTELQLPLLISPVPQLAPPKTRQGPPRPGAWTVGAAVALWGRGLHGYVGPAPRGFGDGELLCSKWTPFWGVVRGGVQREGGVQTDRGPRKGSGGRGQEGQQTGKRCGARGPGVGRGGSRKGDTWGPRGEGRGRERRELTAWGAGGPVTSWGRKAVVTLGL